MFPLLRSASWLLLIATAIHAADQNAAKLVREASNVLIELQRSPDRGIPTDLLANAKCIGVVPSVKHGAFVIGATYGTGALSCRTREGWSSPSFFHIEGGSFGFQIGGSETDFVLLFMNDAGADKLTKDKLSLGGDGTVAAGPIGRTAEAQTDAQMHAEILTYSRSRGLFAGISMDGGVIRPDQKANTALYGRSVTVRDILTGKVKAPTFQEPPFPPVGPPNR